MNALLTKIGGTNPAVTIPPHGFGILIRVVIVATLGQTVAHAQSNFPEIVISQIYGGGGNQGATYKNDFIELFNRGNLPVSVTGWTVQHASATGTEWDRTVLSGTIQPGRYYLVREYQGAGGTLSLPTPDATGAIEISATSDKIALVNNSINLSGTHPTGSAIVDFVGYGTANAAEGSPASALDNTTALIRKSGGCTDTNNNSSDFSTGPPSPRNSSSPSNPCAFPQTTPQISSAGIVSSGSFLTGQIAPGEIVTIFGTGLGSPIFLSPQLNANGNVSTNLGGTQVFFAGVPAPILYTSPTQVSAIAPFATSGPLTSIQVQYEAQVSSSCLSACCSRSSGDLYCGLIRTRACGGVEPGLFSEHCREAGRTKFGGDHLLYRNGPNNPSRRRRQNCSGRRLTQSDSTRYRLLGRA